MSDGTSPTTWRRECSSDGVCTLWFDTPGRMHNVLDPTAIDDLDRCISEIEKDASVRGVLVRSAKAAGFCAGADLKTIEGCRSPTELESYLRRGLAVLDRLAGLGVPTVAVVHGVCLGGGLELALACRSRVALASSAPLQIGCPEIQLGLIPAWGAIDRLPRLLSPRDALNLLLTGNPIGFLQAKSQGLVDRLVSEEEQARIAETLNRSPQLDRALTLEIWRDELAFAAAKAEEQPADFPEAQQILLQVIETDLSEGPEAARNSAIKGCAELGSLPATRHAIADFFERRRGHS
jgi:enoyl-CoA hydratase/carnithine racemase